MAPELLSESPEQTRELGRRLGARLHPGDVVFLEGDLGAGKTTFVQGVAGALGVEATVRSPTFALLHRYRGRPDLIHLDLYRHREGGLGDLDLDEAEAVIVVEWPRGRDEARWAGAFLVRFEHVDPERRRIHWSSGLEARGDRPQGE